MAFSPCWAPRRGSWVCGGSHPGPNARVASEGHFWASQASRGPQQPLLLSCVPLYQSFQDSVPHPHEWIWAVPPPLPGATPGPPGEAPAAEVEQGLRRMGGWRALGPTGLSSPPARSLGEGSFPCFDPSGTVTVGRESWAGCSRLRAASGSPGRGQQQQVGLFCRKFLVWPLQSPRPAGNLPFLSSAPSPCQAPWVRAGHSLQSSHKALLVGLPANTGLAPSGRLAFSFFSPVWGKEK